MPLTDDFGHFKLKHSQYKPTLFTLAIEQINGACMEGVTCFFIDDDADDREMFELALNEIDPKIEYLTASSGEEGLKILDTSEIIPTYIFLDLNMPKMDGWECLREIKKRPQLRHVPVIILSTAEWIRDRLELRKLEIARYITKPNTQAEFTQAISKVLVKEIVL